MINYTTIDKVLPQIKKAVRDNDSKAQLKTYMVEAYRELELPQTTEDKVMLLELKDHKVQLPQEIHKINFITFACNMPENCVNEIDLCKEDDIVYNDTSDYNIYIKLNQAFLKTKAYNNHFVPLKYLQHKHSHLCT